MITDVLRGVLAGGISGCLLFGALCTLIYWKTIGDTNETTYFRFVMMLIPVSALLVMAESNFQQVLNQPLITLIPAVVVFVLCLITCICTLVKELKRERK